MFSRFPGSVDFGGILKRTFDSFAANISGFCLAFVLLGFPQQMPKMRGNVPPEKGWKKVDSSMAR